jgi:hypothetical protein
MRSKNMYDNVTIGNNVVYKEGKNIERCIVKEVKTSGKMKYFTLMSKDDNKTFTVSINSEHGGAYCPWRFIPAKELSDY